jgi:hypothetical protein
MVLWLYDPLVLACAGQSAVLSQVFWGSDALVLAGVLC